MGGEALGLAKILCTGEHQGQEAGEGRLERRGKGEGIGDFCFSKIIAPITWDGPGRDVGVGGLGSWGGVCIGGLGDSI